MICSCCSGHRLLPNFVIVILSILNSPHVSANVPGPCLLLEPHGQGSVCIPVEAINQAFAHARHHFGISGPYLGEHLHDHHDEIDKIGLALQETSRILAKQLHLDWHQIFRWLPTVDTRLTEIWDFCPAQLRNKSCSASRYRSLSGHCNNLEHPDWGATLVPFANILPPSRSDGISAPRDATDGEYLPSARLVSSIMHMDTVVHDHSITTMLIAWGQIIDHDITLTADTKDQVTLKEPECCGDETFHSEVHAPHLHHHHHHHHHHHLHPTHRHHNCFPIQIPRNDPFYRSHGRHCMNFLRSFAGVRSECRLGPRTAFNTISSFIDSNFAYGSTPELGAELRAGKYGLLKSLPVFHDYGLKPLLPPKTRDPDDGCIRPNTDVFCFLAGDVRVNEQLILTVLHTLFMREHNRIAEHLYAINPHWEDELIFQETRRIVIATTQHITFNEFLPMVLGRELMDKYGLTLQDQGYWKGYDPNVNPTAAEEFITSAFRFGHSLLPHRIERWSHTHKFIDSESLHKLLRQPYDVYRPGYIDTFIMGLVNQLAQAMDEGVTEQVTTLLFKEPGKNFGMDLAAMNIQRGREHGVPGYTAYRKICNLSPVTVWDDLIGVMRNETVNKYKTVYRSPHDIDLWSGGVSEISNPGSLVGPTFGCIIAQQFQAARFGDRFWYELPDWPSSFTPAQLQEIRKVKLSRLLCDNSDDIKTIQMYAMVFPDPDLNPRVACQGLRLSGIDFEHWRDSATGSVHTVVHNHILPEHMHYRHDHDHLAHTAPASMSITMPMHTVSGTNSNESQEPVEEDIQNPHRLPPTSNTSDSAPGTVYTTVENIHEPEFSAKLPTVYDGPFHHNEHTQSSSSLPHSSYHYKSTVSTTPTDDHDPSTHYLYHHYYPPNTTMHHEHNYEHQSEEHDHNHDHPHNYVITKIIDNTISNAPPSVETHIVPLPISHVPRRPPTKIIKGLPPVKPYPENHPFPGMDGLFSPNPGYLVRQQFQVYKAPPPPTTRRPHMWQSILG